MGTTLTELAKRTGLSTATISRALNGDTCVSPETREAVMAAVKETGYVKPSRRRSAELRNDRTALIIAGQLQNPIIVGFINGIRHRLAEEGIRTVVSLTDYDSSVECDALSYGLKNSFAGIFMLNVIESPKTVSLVSSAETKVIFVNRYLRSLDTDVVTVDNYRCGYMATRYLIERGHTKIAHIAGPKVSVTCRNRTQGFLDAMSAAGLQVSSDAIFYGDRSYKSGCDMGAKLCAAEGLGGYTAVFSTTGLMAAGMVDTLRAGGIRVPDDISVVCNDDYSRDYMACPIDFTTFGQNPTVMGSTAAELLIDSLGKEKKPPKHIVFPPVLIEHNSVIRKL